MISRTRSLHLSPPSLPPSSSSPSSHPWFFAENEGKLEEFVPGTSLFGLLPDALVEGFQFWKTGEVCVLNLGVVGRLIKLFPPLEIIERLS